MLLHMLHKTSQVGYKNTQARQKPSLAFQMYFSYTSTECEANQMSRNFRGRQIIVHFHFYECTEIQVNLIIITPALVT
jgi:hypothetical protein